MMGSVFGGRLLSCIFLSNVALFYPLAQIGPMAARKKYWVSWNKYVSHQMRCSEVSVSKVLLTSCRFWASFRAWPGIQLRHEMLTHAYSNSPLTVRKNVFIRSWMNFMNCEWQSHLPQFKLDRSVWLSCTWIERQKHTQDSCADLPGSVWFSRFRRATARKYGNLMQFVAWEKNINNTCD